jgi:hypothetical protein
MRKLFRRPSPALVIACLALTVALGGTGYAAITLPRNSVGTKQLKKNAVISSKVKNRSLKRVDFATGQLPRGARGATGATGAQGPQGTGNTCNAGQVSSNPQPTSIERYVNVSTTWTDIASCSITLTASHKVLIVGQYTAQSNSNEGDAFARVYVDGALADGTYWANVSAQTPGTGTGRATLPVSRVVTLAAGAHTITLQGAYYNGGAVTTVSSLGSSISAVDLG